MMTNLTKICRRCNQEKALTDFRKGRVCRDCEREKSRQYAAEHQTQMKVYRKAHPDMVKATKKKYQQTHKQQINDYLKQYRANSDVYKEYKAEYDKSYYTNRKKTDKVFKLKSQMRSAIWDAFYRTGYSKQNKLEQIVGCSNEEFVSHLLTTFKNNYGYDRDGEDVHIDHITPLATANTVDDVISLCHYTNLQLLKPIDNLTKSSKIITKLDDVAQSAPILVEPIKATDPVKEDETDEQGSSNGQDNPSGNSNSNSKDGESQNTNPKEEN